MLDDPHLPGSIHLKSIRHNTPLKQAIYRAVDFQSDDFMCSIIVISLNIRTVEVLYSAAFKIQSRLILLPIFLRASNVSSSGNKYTGHKLLGIYVNFEI